jgi:hypothetical protein
VLRSPNTMDVVCLRVLNASRELRMGWLTVWSCPPPSLQAIVDLARQKDIDPTGLRTLGVLTKPDQIEDGTHAQVGGEQSCGWESSYCHG